MSQTAADQTVPGTAARGEPPGDAPTLRPGAPGTSLIVAPEVAPVATPDAAFEDGASRAARRRLRRRRWSYRCLGIVLTLPVVFAFVFSLVLIGRQVAAPSWLKTDVEARATELLGGGTLSFGGLDLTLGADLHPRVVITNADLRDVDGQIIAQVPRMTALLSPRGLVQGEVLVQEVDLSALQIALRRSTSGDVALQIGATQGTESGSFVDLLDSIDAALEAPRLAALEQVRITDMIVNYDDARAGRSWTVDGGRLGLDLRRDRIRLRGDLSLLSGRAYLTELSLDYESPNGTRAAEIGVDITNGVARDLASQSAALSWLGALDAPLSARIRGEIDATGRPGPVTAELEIGEGALRPTEATRPIPFQSATTYLSFDPAEGQLEFDRIDVASGWGSFSGTGRAWLDGVRDGLPASVLSQFAFSRLTLTEETLYPEPVSLGEGTLAFRLTLEPFAIEIPEVTLRRDASRITASANVAALSDGWAVRTDLGIRAMGARDLIALWPEGWRPGTRQWFDANILGGDIREATLSLRTTPQEPPVIAASFDYADLGLRYLRQFPPIEAASGFGTWEGDRLTVALESGLVRAPQGGAVTLPGSVFAIPDTRQRDAPAEITLATRGTATAMLSLLDLPPFEFLSKANLPVTLADARSEARGVLRLPLKERIGPDEVGFEVTARLTRLRSTEIIPDQTLASTGLDVAVDREGIEISGPLRVGQVPMSGQFSRRFRDNPSGLAEVRADVELSERFLDTFDIPLPPGTMRGDGSGRLELSLARDRPPRFALESDLTGLSVALPALGWRKGPGTAGRFSLSGQLGAAPDIDRFVLAGPGLAIGGDLDLAPGGRLLRARFPDLRAGGWLAGDIELTDRGAGRPMGITLRGGSVDLRALPDMGGGPAPPMTIALDRVTVAEGLELTGFRGEFSGGAGLSGQFTARVNGGGPVRGTLVPDSGGRVAIRLQSDDAGAVLSSAGYLETAVGGRLDLALLPVGAESYDGTLAVRDIRVQDAPALASLLDAISVVGLLQQLDGQGLSFTHVDAAFRVDPDRITITRSSAIGASLGISLDGTYFTAAQQMDFQGVVSPFYLLNGIGAVLTRPGEGLIGFNFTLRGPSDGPRVGVNPLSVFTPGMFREIFRRPPPQVGQ